MVSYRWYGYVVVLSTHFREIGEEFYQAHNHKDSLNSVAISSSLNKAASWGDNSIKMHDMSELKDITNVVRMDDETKGLDHLSWTDDGQLLAISTQKGTLHGGNIHHSRIVTPYWLRGGIWKRRERGEGARNREEIKNDND
ncbi:unnamed protein product [Pleuronectes platessa]|uniref:WDR19 first beta-propeller domain-containing protein n=1 Tax=Pleuronectes platessa TaxID=8262 RepID=A0A9N7U0F3_PLEPL|nr:unnamed protein product [Pleuronectes platessa]